MGKQLNQRQIEQWLAQYHIKNYTIVANEQHEWVVDVDDNINLNYKGIAKIPVKFGRVSGYFVFSYNQLTNLSFAPEHVGGSFDCSYNKLTSLQDSPQIVLGDFNCNNNALTSLQFCPHEVIGEFNCENNQIQNLEFCPKTVGGIFSCNRNKDLGDWQRIWDFEKIHQLHLEIENIKIEKEVLSKNFTYQKKCDKIYKI